MKSHANSMLANRMNGVICLPLLLLLSQGAESARTLSAMCPPQTSKTFKCTHKNLDSVPSKIRQDTTSVDLSNNEIQILHQDSFSSVSQLRRLILDNNKLFKITQYTFDSLPRLEELSLRNNNLVIQDGGLSAAAFQTLPNLQALYLSHNPLGRLPKGFFTKLGQLRLLHVDNAVHGLRIEPRAFRGLRSLRDLSLANNRLTSLSAELSEDLSEMYLRRLALEGNDWNCDCRLRWFARWFSATSSLHSAPAASTSTAPKCAQPPALRNSPLFRTNITKFQCRPRIHTLPHYIRAKEYDNVTLSCEFESDPKTYVMWFRDVTYVQSWFRFSQRETKGRRYVANLTISDLRKEDEGVYRCQTSNDRGTASTNISLLVQAELVRGLKLDKVIVLVGIAVTGIVVLLAAVGIIVYCFYGRDPTKYTAANHAKNGWKMNSPHQRPLIQASANNGSVGGGPRMLDSDNEEGGGPVATNHPPPRDYPDHLATTKKRLLVTSASTNSTLQRGGCNSSASALLRQEAVPLTTQLSLDRTASSVSGCPPDASPHPCLGINEDCPVHGNRLNYSPCPVHGTLTRASGASASSPVPGYGGTLSNHKQCPVHGSQTGTNQPGLQSILRARSPPLVPVATTSSSISSGGFMRASQVDDCISPTPPPPHAPLSPGGSERYNNPGGFVLPSTTTTSPLHHHLDSSSPGHQQIATELHNNNSTQRLERTGFCHATHKQVHSDLGVTTAV